MLSKFIDQVKKVFEPRSPHQDLDDFIRRQNPTSIGDVEYWIKVYDRKQNSGLSTNVDHYHYR